MSASRGVFFDFDGTLVEPFVDPFPTYREVLAAHGIALERPRFDAAWRTLPTETAADAHRYLGKTDEYWRRWDARALAALKVPDPRGKIVRALREACVAPRWHRPFPESRSVLEELRDLGYSLHIISNHTEDLLRVLEALDWRDLFGSVSFSQEVGVEKPDPELFELALTRAKLERARTVHVGDSWDRDVVGARRVGLRPVWLNREGAPIRAGVPAIADLHGVLALLD
jgi:HAD superfamily hydrolase (TIGR01509 family)